MCILGTQFSSNRTLATAPSVSLILVASIFATMRHASLSRTLSERNSRTAAIISLSALPPGHVLSVLLPPRTKSRFWQKKETWADPRYLALLLRTVPHHHDFATFTGAHQGLDVHNLGAYKSPGEHHWSLATRSQQRHLRSFQGAYHLQDTRQF